MSAKDLKHQKIFNELYEKIRLGQYAPNDQLPAERELAETYGVARTTARRALTDLTAMGLAVRRGRRGTIVSPGGHRKQTDTLNLVCSAEPLASVAEFLLHGVEAAEKASWGVKITRVALNDELTTWRALKLGSRHIVFAAGFESGLGDKLTKGLQNAKDRSVVLGTKVDHLDIHSVVCNDSLGIRMAVERLKDLGHTKIALLSGGETPDHPILALMLKEWKTGLKLCMTDQDFRECLIHVQHKPFQDLALVAYETTTEFLAKPASQGVTAIITLYTELATGASAACKNKGLRIPEDISIMEYGITQRAKLFNPTRAGISPRLDLHMGKAMELLRAKDLSNPDTNKLHKIKPTLIDGASIGPAKEVS